jgi:hypothetical protein
MAPLWIAFRLIVPMRMIVRVRMDAARAMAMTMGMNQICAFQQRLVAQ